MKKKIFNFYYFLLPLFLPLGFSNFSLFVSFMIFSSSSHFSLLFPWLLFFQNTIYYLAHEEESSRSLCKLKGKLCKSRKSTYKVFKALFLLLSSKKRIYEVIKSFFFFVIHYPKKSIYVVFKSYSFSLSLSKKSMYVYVRAHFTITVNNRNWMPPRWEQKKVSFIQQPSFSEFRVSTTLNPKPFLFES